MEKLAGYDAYRNKEFVENYVEKNLSNLANAHVERPGIIPLIPEITAEDSVLDAGCGGGVMSRYIAEKGARVTGIDYSPEMLAYAKEKTEKEDVKFLIHDLNQPLPFPENSFSGVFSSLALHYVKDWQKLFAEFQRVLRPEGWVVFSCGSPVADQVDFGGNYYDVEWYDCIWPSFGVNVSAYKRPLSDMFRAFHKNGFRVEELVEPRPDEKFREQFPKFDKFYKEPWGICFRLKKISG